jgi:hypothetical protein
MPFTAALAIGAIAAPIVAGQAGQAAAAGDRANAEQAAQQAYAEFKKIKDPSMNDMQILLETLNKQGVLTPEMEQAIQQDNTAMSGITTDPRLRNAQMNALDTMTKMGQTGLTPEDLAALDQTRRQVGGDEHSRQQSILNNMQQRGAGGSGMELAARLASSQGAADRASQQSDSTMAMAQQRMLQALSQSGQLGGAIRDQDFGEQSKIAQAKDTIANFNANQRASTQARNINSVNEANAKNLAEQQRIADANAATRNAQQQYNKGLHQTIFQNEMQLGGARANASLGQANMYNNEANAVAGQYQQIGNGVGNLLGAGAKFAATPSNKVTTSVQPSESNYADPNQPWFGSKPQ